MVEDEDHEVEDESLPYFTPSDDFEEPPSKEEIFSLKSSRKKNKIASASDGALVDVSSKEALLIRWKAIGKCLDMMPDSFSPAELLLDGLITLALDLIEEIEYEFRFIISPKSLNKVVKEEEDKSDELGNVLMRQIPLKRPFLQFHPASTIPTLYQMVEELEKMKTSHRLSQVPKFPAFHGGRVGSKEFTSVDPDRGERWKEHKSRKRKGFSK